MRGDGSVTSESSPCHIGRGAQVAGDAYRNCLLSGLVERRLDSVPVYKGT